MSLLTCQKAKGLEWPVVIPLGLARSIKEATAEYPRIEESAEEITVHVSNVTVSKEDNGRDTARREELQRVFYVTLTRAKSLLVFPDTLRLYRTSKDSFMELCLWEGLGCETLFEPPRPLKK